MSAEIISLEAHRRQILDHWLRERMGIEPHRRERTKRCGEWESGMVCSFIRVGDLATATETLTGFITEFLAATPSEASMAHVWVQGRCYAVRVSDLLRPGMSA